MEYASEHCKNVEVPIAADNVAGNFSFIKYCSEHNWVVADNGVCELYAPDDADFYEREVVLKAHYNM